MSKFNTYLGEFEELVLMAIVAMKDNAYGVTLRQLLEAETGRSVSYGALYTTLDRLERKGFVTSWQGGATAIRGGRAKRFFKVEGLGHQVLRETRTARANLAKLQPAAEF
jgi:PadR family transcriptional regulator, regulatory protein PadR